MAVSSSDMVEKSNEVSGPIQPGESEPGYKFLTQSAALLNLTSRGRICVLGSDREKFLHGQVTNDVKRLQVGEGTYAALVNAKAKMEADLFIYKLNEEFLLDFEPGLTQRIKERLEKYIISEDVQIVDVAAHYGLISIQGPKAGDAIRLATLPTPAPEYSLHFVSWEEPGSGEVYLMNHPRLGTGGFDLFVPTVRIKSFQDRLLCAVEQVGGGRAGDSAFELARTEAGIPRFGIDMDETNMPQEAEIQQRAVSFSKGCYIGQEIIARVRTYGQVAKALRFLEFGSSSPPAKGVKLFRQGREVGYVTSAALSPHLGRVVGLGYVRREANALGTELKLAEPEGPLVKVMGMPRQERPTAGCSSEF